MQPQQFQVGVKAVIIVAGRVLLLQRRDRVSGTFWELPGGRMEGDEEIEETLQRELLEELPGIGQVVVGPLLHAARVTDATPGIILLFYQVEANISEVVVSDEHLGHTWMDAEGLAALARGESESAIFPYTLAAAERGFQVT